MSKKTSHNIFKIIMKPFVSLLNESIYLLITAFISSIIDNQFGIIFWVVGATITLIRWLKPSTTLQINKIENYKLLAGDMVTISDKVRSQNFNAKLLMSLLYDLEKRGAVYSPWIFNLLDKRISRESI
jgi:hypothetical protein